MEFIKQNMLITGASSGIGLGLAKSLYEQGARNLTLTGRDLGRLEQKAAGLGHLVACNQANIVDVNQLCDDLKADGSPLVVVANVGINPTADFGIKKLQNTPVTSIEAALTVNVTHTIAMLSKLIVAMKGARFGRIVLVGSQAYLHGIPGQLGYNVSKAALVGLKNTIVQEYGKAGVFCHLVNPGLVENERTALVRKRNPNVQTIPQQLVVDTIIDALLIDDAAQNGQEINI